MVKGLEPVAVCYTDPVKLDWAERTLPGVGTFNNYDELLSAGVVDAVIIATPHFMHPDMAVKAFDNGLHVLVEKPAGVYINQVLRTNRAALQSGKVFAIMFNQRTNPVYQKVREIIKNDEFEKQLKERTRVSGIRNGKDKRRFSVGEYSERWNTHW